MAIKSFILFILLLNQAYSFGVPASNKVTDKTSSTSSQGASGLEDLEPEIDPNEKNAKGVKKRLIFIGGHLDTTNPPDYSPKDIANRLTDEIHNNYFKDVTYGKMSVELGFVNQDWIVLPNSRVGRKNSFSREILPNSLDYMGRTTQFYNYNKLFEVLETLPALEAVKVNTDTDIIFVYSVESYAVEESNRERSNDAHHIPSTTRTLFGKPIHNYIWRHNREGTPLKLINRIPYFPNGKIFTKCDLVNKDQCVDRTYVHEIFHLMGGTTYLSHSKAYSSTQSILSFRNLSTSEYGDKFQTLGFPNLGMGLNGFYRAKMNLINGKQIEIYSHHVLNNEKTFEIQRLDKLDGTLPVLASIVIPNSGNYYIYLDYEPNGQSKFFNIMDYVSNYRDGKYDPYNPYSENVGLFVRIAKYFEDGAIVLDPNRDNLSFNGDKEGEYRTFTLNPGKEISFGGYTIRAISRDAESIKFSVKYTE